MGTPISEKTVLDNISTSPVSAFKEMFEDYHNSERSRQRIKNVVVEYAESVPFSKKVKEYAGDEIESRLYKGTSYYVKVVFIPIIVALISSYLLSLLK